MSNSHIIIDSPLGDLLIVAGPEGLTNIAMTPFDPPESETRRSPVLTAAKRQLAAYFSGKLSNFDLPLAPAGTPFMHLVWDEVGRVPLGSTITYADLAQRVGRPGHFRAVGSANARNPLPIVVPCHRIVGSGGQLTGYGGGIDRKRWLIDHEAAITAAA
jgi:methylated-DNA-[protein]-cysteine S-methyltransferase